MWSNENNYEYLVGLSSSGTGAEQQLSISILGSGPLQFVRCNGRGYQTVYTWSSLPYVYIFICKGPCVLYSSYLVRGLFGSRLLFGSGDYLVHGSYLVHICSYLDFLVHRGLFGLD